MSPSRASRVAVVTAYATWAIVAGAARFTTWSSPGARFGIGFVLLATALGILVAGIVAGSRNDRRTVLAATLFVPEIWLFGRLCVVQPVGQAAS